MSDEVKIALLRGINVGGKKKVRMAELRSLCEKLGYQEVQSYIQSGNLVFRSDREDRTIESQLSDAIQSAFRFPVSVMVRSAAQWTGYVGSNPFPDAATATPNLVMLGLSVESPAPDAAAQLAERAAAGERIIQSGDALWIHFPNGSGTSKLTPSVLDRMTGSPVTMRNWRTVLKLAEMAAGS